MLELHSLLHSSLIKGLVIVELCFVLWESLALKVHVGGVVWLILVRLLIRHVCIPKDVEDLFVDFFDVLDLFRTVIF